MRTLVSLLKCKFRRDEGSSLVELALASTLLSTMILGAAELGRLAWAAIETTNAAHAGVQYASTSHAAAADYAVSSGTYSGGIVTAAMADPDGFGTNSTIAVSNITPVCTCANSKYTPTSCTDNSTCSSNNTVMEETITVQTKSTFYPLIHVPGLPNSFTLYGQATQRVSNQ